MYMSPGYKPVAEETFKIAERVFSIAFCFRSHAFNSTVWKSMFVLRGYTFSDIWIIQFRCVTLYGTLISYNSALSTYNDITSTMN